MLLCRLFNDVSVLLSSSGVAELLGISAWCWRGPSAADMCSCLCFGTAWVAGAASAVLAGSEIWESEGNGKLSLMITPFQEEKQVGW